jgi:hypothetical protein
VDLIYTEQRVDDLLDLFIFELFFIMFFQSTQATELYCVFIDRALFSSLVVVSNGKREKLIQLIQLDRHQYQGG